MSIEPTFEHYRRYSAPRSLYEPSLVVSPPMSSWGVEVLRVLGVAALGTLILVICGAFS